MDIHLWIPFAIGIGSLLMCYLVIFSMPQTTDPSFSHTKTDSRRPNVQMGDDGSNRTLLDDSSSCEHLGSTNSEGLENYSELDSTSASFDSGSEDLATILKQKNTLFTLPIFFISTFRATTLNVLLQYTSIRYGWKLSRV